MQASAQELVGDVIYQLGALREIARLAGSALQHVKLHGALYMHAARDDEFASALIEALQQLDPQLYLYCLPGSVCHERALAYGQPVVREFYADRDYDRSGSIVFTRRVDRLDPQAVAQKVLQACLQGVVDTVEGEQIEVEFDSVCIHSDTPGVLQLVQATRATLAAHGIAISGFRPQPR